MAAGLANGGVKKLCDEHLQRAQSLLAQIRALGHERDAALTWAEVLGRVDDVYLELSLAAGFPSLMAVSHPDKSVREVARECEPEVEKFRTDMMLDAEFAAVVRRYADTHPALDGTRARLLRDLRRDLRRNGLELPADQQQTLRQVSGELAKLTQQFVSNIADTVLSLRVRPSQLRGMPAAFVEQHPPAEDGMVTLTTNYPDYFPVITYCEDRTVARELTRLFDSRAAHENLPILDRVLQLRAEKARLLGYPSWAAYAIEPRMAKTVERVHAFLGDVETLLREPANAEYALFEAEYRRLGYPVHGRIPGFERPFIEQKLRADRHGYDGKKLAEYFEVRRVTRGLRDIVSSVFGVELRDVPDAVRWHDDVQVVDVAEQGTPVGRFYLDLYPREGKYKHAAMFEIRTGKQLSDGRMLPPIAALVCNFPKPGTGPALMTHSEVVTFFHEFGHLMHHILTRQPLAA